MHSYNLRTERSQTKGVSEVQCVTLPQENKVESHKEPGTDAWPPSTHQVQKI